MPGLSTSQGVGRSGACGRAGCLHLSARTYCVRLVRKRLGLARSAPQRSQFPPEVLIATENASPDLREMCRLLLAHELTLDPVLTIKRWVTALPESVTWAELFS
eukprot:scaffold29582_cov42-Prasinocladus_malaysianus.AAC.2